MKTTHRPGATQLAALGLLLGLVSADAMDRVRVETRVDDARARYDVTGRNVLIAILDRGIDWENADFRNADGTSRIEYIYDLTDPSGAGQPGNFLGKGTIFTRAQIDAALAGGPSLATRDAVGHGTTTSGIAAGGGRNNALYRGIAPEAHLIMVKLVADGTPAHDGEAAEAPFFDPNLIPVALDFVTTKAAELAMPCVMLLNIGSVGGPTDGTSKLCRKIDATVGPGRPGLAFVTGTSDDGSAANRAGGTVGAGGTVTLELQKVGAGTLDFDLWYSEADRFDASIITPNGTFGPYVAPVGPNSSDTRTTADFRYYQLGRDRDFHEAANDKRELWMRISGPAGKYQIQLTGKTVSNGRFDATINPSRFQASGVAISRFLNFVAPGSIWDLATASNNICPNSYVGRNAYTDIDGFPHTLNEGALGGLWKGSGVGPTFDGRLGVDVSAPGDSLFTVYAPKSYWATLRFNRIASPAGVYGRASAVSAANPIVTGIVALLLEMDPTLDAAQLRQLLHDSARADSFTGDVPNPDFGHGKVDALGALDRLHARLTQLHVATLPDQRLRITARGQPGKTYSLEESPDLNSWQPAQSAVAEISPMQFDVAPGVGPQFFRLAR